MALAGLVTSLAAVNSSTQIISSTMGGIQSGISMIGDLLSKIWGMFSGAAKDALAKIKSLWEEHIGPILEPWIERARTVFGILKDLFMGLVSRVGEALASIPEKLGALKDGIIEKLSGVKEFILGIPFTIGSAIGKVADKIRNTIGRIRDRLGGIRETVGGVFSGILDKMGGIRDSVVSILSGIVDKIKAPFEYVWGIVEKIKNAVTGAVGKAIDKIGSLNLFKDSGGGGNTESTTVGTAVQGGITQYFTMNINVSGMTDRSDKRTVAREMGQLIQEEMARSMGGTTTQSRYA